jgi:hypothetical protein
MRLAIASTAIWSPRAIAGRNAVRKSDQNALLRRSTSPPNSSHSCGLMISTAAMFSFQ